MMATSEFRRNLISGASLILLALFLAASATPRWPKPHDDKPAMAMVLAVDPSSSKVKWELGGSLHTVHGTFRVARGKVEFDASIGKADGEIVVDAKSGESGNDSRDKKMHNDVLESVKFGEIVFHPDRVEGKVASSSASTIRIHGTFDIHGGRQELIIPMQVELSKDHWKGTGKFKVPYVQWGMKNPSNFFLKVDSEVEVEVEMTGGVQGVSEGKS
jgi:polyisoprenoid-binding protein YceI